MRHSQKIFHAILIVSFALPLFANPLIHSEKLDHYLESLGKNNKCMFGVTISKNNEILYHNQTGFASLQNKKLLNDSTIFRIGSITKTFTSAMIFQLIDNQKLSLDTKLSVFYPEIPNADNIAISHLLQHRSGLFNITEDPSYSDFRTKEQSRDKIISRIAGYDPMFAPDEKFTYSNSNYILLGFILEEVLNQSYDIILKEQICDPIDLKNTYFGKHIDINHNEPQSYKYNNGNWQLESETHLSIPCGAGAIVSTPDDLTKFIFALFNHQLVSEQSLLKMKEMKDGSGCGLLRFPFYDRFAYGHNGGIDGFVSNLAYFPDDQVSIAVTANAVNYPFNDILIGIISIFYDLPYDIPDFSALDQLNNRLDFNQYCGIFSSSDLPLKITLSVKENTLFAQATGQSAFPLTPVSETEFRFDAAGLVILFNQLDNGSVNYLQFAMKQAGRKFTYKKE